MAGSLLDELLLLCRAAAEAGEDWRGCLEREWLPQLLAAQEGRLRADLLAWTGHAAPSSQALAKEVVAALADAMADVGYE